MLGANGLANFIGAVLVNALLTKVEEHLLSMSIASAFQTFHIVFTTTAFSFAVIFTLLYERPIRQYLNALSLNHAYSDPNASCGPYGRRQSYTASFNTSYHAPNSSYSTRRYSSTGTTTLGYIRLRICFLKSKFHFDNSGESKFNQPL
jgi:hypothetical protein